MFSMMLIILPKKFLKIFVTKHEHKIQNKLTCQGSFFSSVSKFSLSQLNKMWSNAQSKLPKNIYNFTIRYINNSLPTRQNLQRWGISSSSDCTFCLCPESSTACSCRVPVLSGTFHVASQLNSKFPCAVVTICKWLQLVC